MEAGRSRLGTCPAESPGRTILGHARLPALPGYRGPTQLAFDCDILFPASARREIAAS